ncbi:MAG TPA: response regulator [Meiothermus sp.]|nr:response regulator [Meiothermus sp.]
MIRARIGEVELGDLLRALETARKSAVVTVETPNLYGRIHLMEGRLVYARTEPGPHLGEYLVRLLYLTLEDTQRLVLEQERENPGTPLGQLALRAGLVSEEDLTDALQVQVMEALATLMNQKDGTLLAESTPVGEASQIALPQTLETSAMLFEAARRLDEWQRGRVEPEAVLRVANDPTRHPLTPEAWSVLELVNGIKRAKSIALESDLPEDQVYHLLFELKSRGLVEETSIRPSDPLILVLAESSLIRRLLLVTLERSRYRVLMPHDLESAKRMMAKHKPQGIILQGQDLMDRVRQIRSHPDGRFPPLWVVSEDPPRGLWVRSARLGHIPKPFSEEDVLEAMSVIKRAI